MWPLRKIFTGLVFCVFILGSIFIIRFRLTRTSPLPVFLRGVNRFHSSRVCAPLVTILVNSAPENTHRRQVIRETWGHIAVTRKLDVAVAFGVGETTIESAQKLVDWEAATFGDVFQTMVLEEYKALPLKILSILEKLKDACDVPPLFIVKTDDDVFVNVYALRDLLKTLQMEAVEMKLWCLVWEGMPVVRDNESKYGVSKERYPASFYPNYCSGSAYIVNQKVLRALLQQHSGELFLPFEDVYITGILAEKANVEHVQLGTRYAFETVTEEGIASGQTIFGHLGPNAEERVEHFWNYLTWKRNQQESEEGLR